MSESFTLKLDGAELYGERWPGDGPVLVLLHEGVSDLRGWRQTAEILSASADVVAYDRRGYGRTEPSPAPFTHLDDLLAVLDQFTDGPAWLVGASAGGGLALDTALLAPERVAGLILIAPAVTGAPEPEIDPATQVLGDLLGAAYDANDAAEINRLETWIWLDGPAQPEGRVGGPARDLALDMNAIIIGHGDLEDRAADTTPARGTGSAKSGCRSPWPAATWTCRSWSAGPASSPASCRAASMRCCPASPISPTWSSPPWSRN